jgi:osmotically-inducible protein OsmY
MDEKAGFGQGGDSRRVLQDGALVEEVARAISSSGHIPEGHVEVSSADGAVKLRGRVGSYYQKQIAQTLALNVIGRRRLVNEIEVA